MTRLQLRAFVWAIVGGTIVAAAHARAEDQRSDAVRIFNCDFGSNWDVNYDLWPDRWSRSAAFEHPHYVKIAIHDDATAAGQRCLQFELDGAAAEVTSPPIPVLSRFRYMFEASLKTESLHHSSVATSLDFCDAAGRVLFSKSGKPVSVTKGWHTLALGPIEPGDANIDHAIIRIKVDRGSKGDLHGRVAIADVWLARLPRIAVSTNNPCNVYTDASDVVVQCELSGIRESNPEIRFQLLDAYNREIDATNVRLKGKPITSQSPSAHEEQETDPATPNGFEGTETWRPKIPGFGFFRVAVKMLSAESEAGENQSSRQFGDETVCLAVVPPLDMPKQGEFGWTLPAADQPLAFQELSRLLPQVAINWVKLPVWFDANDPHRGDELVRFVELLGASNIETVGIIDRPPETVELPGQVQRDTSVEDILNPSSPWLPILEPVMTRLSLRVRWWQLGSDGDTSFSSVTDLVKRIEELRTLLFRFGQDVRLGICWPWEPGNEIIGETSWNFEQLHLQSQRADEQLPVTDEEFEALLTKPRNNTAQHWIMVEPPPLPEGEMVYDEAAQVARASRFVRRLVSAKVHGATRIIVSNPFKNEIGLMRVGSTGNTAMPGELLLPWRTTAAMLGGAVYLGQMQLPAGSENRIFRRPDGQVVMVAWNDAPEREVLYLGENIRCVALDGKTARTESVNGEQIVETGPAPLFVLGLHEAITRWRMAVEFERNGVPSIFKKPHANVLKFTNFFSQGVGGSVQIVVPEINHIDDQASGADATKESVGFVPKSWNIEPERTTFTVANGQDFKFPFEVRLKSAYFGKQPVRLDFKIQADVNYTFSVYSELEVGTDDLTLDVNTHLDKDGALIVEQLMTNRAKNTPDFRCYLYPKAGRRAQRMQVYRLGSEIDRKLYRLPDGAELVGRSMLLEIEELNGPRVLRYRFVPTAESSLPGKDTSESSNQDPAGEKLEAGATPPEESDRDDYTDRTSRGQVEPADTWFEGRGKFDNSTCYRDCARRLAST